MRMPRRNRKPVKKTNPLRILVFIIGLVVCLWGVAGIGVSAGLPPLSIVSLQTPVGTVTTNDRQFGGGIILAFIGLVMMIASAAMK